MEEERRQGILLPKMEKVLVCPEGQLSVLVHQRGGKSEPGEKEQRILLKQVNCIDSLSFFFALLSVLFRMRKPRVSSVFQSLRSIGPANVARSSECLFQTVPHKYSPARLPRPLLPSCTVSLFVPSLPSAFKACHPKVKSFYFAAEGVDDMNR